MWNGVISLDQLIISIKVRVAIGLYSDQEGKLIDEIKIFYDCRYLSSCEEA